VTALRVVLACQEAAGHHAFRRVVDGGHRIVAVFTDPSREPSGTSPVGDAAAAHRVNVREAALVRDPALAAWLRDEAVDLLLNVHSLHLVAEAVVEAPTIGSFNLHPGPLPGYPGLNAPSWAIYERRTSYGCTVHWMNAAIDAGHVAYESGFAVGARDTGLTLTARCVREGIPLLDRLLEDAATDATRVPRRKQAGERVERGAGPPNDGRVVWAQPAEQIAAFVRACDYGPFPSPWGKPRVWLDGEELTLARADAGSGAVAGPAQPGQVLASEGDELVVAAGGGTVLRISRLERDGESVAPVSVTTPGARFSA
jgi:methionyl-tRNA formyltransferase